MAVLLKDLAKATGFSIPTISLALNNSPRISEETKRIVLEAAKAQHYIPNRVARSLVTRQSKMIGLIVRQFDNFVLSKVAAMLETELAWRGYGLLLVTTTPPRNEMEALLTMEAQQVDGIFMFPTLPPSKQLLEYVQNTETPIVFLSYGKYEHCTDAVYYDREYATYTGTRHLLDLGHTDIGLICGTSTRRQVSVDGERLNGYIRALSERGVPFDMGNTLIPSGIHDYQSGFEAAGELMRRHNLTGIVVANDLIACGAIQYFLMHGVRIPEDISVVGNDSTEVAEYFPVPITSTKYDVEALVNQALPIMMERIQNRDQRGLPKVIPLKSSLDVRKSSAKR